ncbi:MAG: hypothetical protein JWL83_3623 [Actinomycetia bacterium]|nr:hypothetical protein [Actinomycetes bacterium]
MTSLRSLVNRVPIGVRVVAGVVLGLIALNLVARAVDQSVGGSEPTGTPGSSYATAPGGLAAYAALLTHDGHGVSRQRGDFVQAAINPAATLMILDPDVLTENEAGVALQFVVNGGRLVIGGNGADRYLHRLRDRPPIWTLSDRSAFASTHAPFEDITRVNTNGGGMWRRNGTSRAVVGGEGHALVTTEPVGRGEILFLADVSPLTNANLDAVDNAGFGLVLAGGAHQPVVFAEGVHGYGAARGFSAIPSAWKLAFVGLALAALLFVWARGRRLGPPEATERVLPPPRREYVDALAITLERTRDRDNAVAPVRTALRARIAQRAGLGPEAGPADYERAGRSLGLSEEEAHAMLRGAVTDDDVVMIGRALTRVERWDIGRNE